MKLLIVAAVTAMLCSTAAQARGVIVAPGTSSSSLPRMVAAGGEELARDAMRFLNSGNPTGNRGPWCAFFGNFILQRHGYRTSGSGMAASMRFAGHPTRPHPGAIAWNYRHTGFVLAVNGNEVVLVSGNTHRGVVGISHYNVQQFNYVEPQKG